MCTVHPSARMLSWAWGCLDPHRAHFRVLLTFGIGHCICTGHTVQLNQMPGAGSFQCRAAVSGTPGHSLTWGAPELLMGTASFTKPSGIYFQDAPALGTAPRHTPHLDPSPAHWGCLIPWGDLYSLSTQQAWCCAWGTWRRPRVQGLPAGSQSQRADHTACEDIGCRLGFGQRAKPRPAPQSLRVLSAQPLLCRMQNGSHSAGL